jgi:hypothetical protein
MLISKRSATKYQISRVSAFFKVLHNQQRNPNAERKTERSPSPDALMMSIAGTPLSIYLKK